MNGAPDTAGRIGIADAADAAHNAATSGSHTTNRRRFAKALFPLSPPQNRTASHRASDSGKAVSPFRGSLIRLGYAVFGFRWHNRPMVRLGLVVVALATAASAAGAATQAPSLKVSLHPLTVRGTNF